MSSCSLIAANIKRLYGFVKYEVTMPKISEERRAERREQILAGARSCFAEHGYEGATVARLEEATGLSRGAIFNYFDSKEDLFVELAVEDTARMSGVWVSEGLEAVVHAVLELDPAWLGVYLELVRRVRTDPDFRRRIEERQEAIVPVNRARLEEAQRAGELRDDLDARELGAFFNLVLNGLALQRASGDEPPPAELVVRLIEDAIGGPARSRTPSRTRP
jgi:AcrR family transcriptional regulator